MLQRAASNAYSWWWASHIRTKQSKWLEQNLQDMEEKMQAMLKLIQEDGDSFAKRAEMYYKRRPELINFVEETYRAYRALADRYDHISTELQNANNTIAYVFPEQAQFAMEDDEDEAAPNKLPKKPQEAAKGNVPKVPKLPKEVKGFISSATKKLQSKKAGKGATTTSAKVVKSGFSKPEGIKEIDKLQKQILALQTEKEFAKSSYEGNLSKYWEIEERITGMQERVFTLEDEFGAGPVIEDNDARNLMASAALKSCEEVLTKLEEKQERNAEKAVVEHERITDAREKLDSLKDELLQGQTDQDKPPANDDRIKAGEKRQSLDQEVSSDTKETQELELLRDKVKVHFDVGAGSSLTASELAEKVDELVNKVISLETAVSSQSAVMQRLRTDTDELQAEIRTLEDDKATLISSKNDLSDKLREMEEKFRGLQDLDRNVEQQNTNLQTHFTEARCNLDHLSEKLHNVTPDDELLVKLPTKEASKVKVESEKKVKEQEILANSNSKPEKMEEVEQGELHSNPKPDKMEEVKKGELLEVSDPLKERETPAEASLVTELNGEKEEPENSDDPEKDVDEKAEQARQELDLHESDRDLTDNLSETPKNSELQNVSEKDHDHKSEEKIDKQVSSKILADHLNDEAEEQEPNWKQLFMNGMENREKVLLSEYTTVLRNFKDMKKRLTESDYKTGDQLFDTTLKLKELKNSNAKKDEQIRFLRNKLSILRAGMGDDEEFEKSTVAGSPRTEKDMTEDIPGMLMDQHDNISEIEQRFRESIDEVLEENLDFWLRFSTTLQQIQKFGTEVEDLQSELTKLEKKKKHEGSSTARFSLKSDVKPIYRHLREIHTELTLWIEKSMSLKDEVKSRFSSLCAIQEEITAALKDSAEDDDFRFTSYQAAKFRGEILNMKQENNKVADELQAGLDHVTTLQLEIEQTLAKLNEEFKLAGSKNRQNIQLTHTESRSRVPLHSFIFGNKQKRQKPSFFACVHPVLHRKYHELRSGTSL